jgi:hypothetical protein
MFLFKIINLSKFSTAYISTGSSVSLVSDYGLDDRQSRFDPRQKQRIFPLASVSTPALGPTYSPVQWVLGSFPRGGKVRPRRDADHSPHLVQRSWMSRSYTFSSPCASIGVLWDCFALVRETEAGQLIFMHISYMFTSLHMWTRLKLMKSDYLDVYMCRYKSIAAGIITSKWNIFLIYLF